MTEKQYHQALANLSDRYLFENMSNREYEKQRTEIVLSNAMMRMLELEAKLAVLQTPPIKNKLFYKFRLFVEKVKLIRQIRQHQKNHSQRA